MPDEVITTGSTSAGGPSSSWRPWPRTAPRSWTSRPLPGDAVRGVPRGVGTEFFIRRGVTTRTIATTTSSPASPPRAAEHLRGDDRTRLRPSPGSLGGAGHPPLLDLGAAAGLVAGGLALGVVLPVARAGAWWPAVAAAPTVALVVAPLRVMWHGHRIHTVYGTPADHGHRRRPARLVGRPVRGAARRVGPPRAGCAG